ncbi:hypothetical protein C0Q70_11420 [Pomacea canaliculata]|uniref:Origin recognition complex subunit 3 n=1 Tax=Pomacea canaliculata TaxID=400727 RepID=A0A2T7P5X0_POMCA|nr:hypothetical protein C0Q70_11420 [Pomacea canaliculata]
MSTSESVAKGCFPFKGKKKIARAKDYLPADNKQATLQFSTYEQMWSSVDKKFQELQLEVNNKIFEDLLIFVENSHQQFGQHYSVQEIPTAALITGVNTPDHAVIFSNLFAMLQARVTSLVATLRAKDCTSVKYLLGMMLKQLLALPDLSEEGENTQMPSMLTLVKHYSTRYQVSKKSPRKSSPKKRRSVVEDTQYPVVVIMLEDTENFPPHVLQDFIVICSNYLDRLPVVLVLGIATSVTTVHRLLPTAVSSLLCMEMFKAPPSSQYLNLLIDKILMTSAFPFRLGPKVFRLMLDLFLYYHMSVINFVTAFQFSMLDHYASNSLSHLCCPTSMIPSVIDNLSSKELQQLQRLPSVMRYMEQMPPKVLASVLQEEEKFRKLIKFLLKDYPVQQDRSTVILHLLHSLTSHLPMHPLGKQLRELYAACLESDIHETDNFRKAFELLGMTARSELVSVVTQGLQKISYSSDPVLKDVIEKLQQFLHRFDHLEDEVVEDTESSSPKPKDLKLQRTDLRSLQKRIVHSIKPVWPAYSVVNQLGKAHSLATRLELRKHLHKAEDSVLYEIFYYDNVTSFRHQLHASPRSAIHRALGDPANYLECQCCLVDGGCISATMPDISIAYKLHLECGFMINLYDWLQAFVSIVTADEQNKKKSSKPEMLQYPFPVIVLSDC